MPLSSIAVSEYRSRWTRILRKGMRVALCMTVLSGSALAGDQTKDDVPPLMQSSRLRAESRMAAERGEFVLAADKLEQAAMTVGDRTTAKKAADTKEQLQANGGSQADFQTLMTLIMEQTSPPALWIQNGDEIGSMSPFLQGVFVGAPAMAEAMAMTTDNTRLITAAELARTANNNNNVHETSRLRLVSLPRLEQHIQDLKAAGKPVTEDMKTLAGLTSVEFLFVFPDTGDVVIGGPAGDWKKGEDDRYLSLDNNRPTLQLDDLVTLSRTFGSNGQGFFMCTIDPKPEQVKAVKELAANLKLSAGNVRETAEKLEQTLGLQNVHVGGVPADSRVADVIVDADYQMKLIGIGERKGAEGMKSYFELVGRDERRGSSMDALRWWMTVGYDAIQVAPNGLSYEFSGRSIRCLSENQIVGNDGSRQSTGKADGANAEFAKLFTENLPALAEQDVVFADLQNIFDLALATTIVNTMGLQRQAGWQPEVFTAGSDFQTQAVDVPEELMTAANFKTYRGGDIMIQVAGGIRADMKSVVSDPKNFEVSPEVAKAAKNANPVGQGGRWWWDAAAR